MRGHHRTMSSDDRHNDKLERIEKLRECIEKAYGECGRQLDAVLTLEKALEYLEERV